MSCNNPTKLSQMGSTKNNMDKLNYLTDNHCDIKNLIECQPCCRLDELEHRLDAIDIQIDVINKCLQKMQRYWGPQIDKEAEEISALNASSKTLTTDFQDLHTKIDQQKQYTDAEIAKQNTLMQSQQASMQQQLQAQMQAQNSDLGNQIAGLNNGNSTYVTQSQYSQQEVSNSQKYATQSDLSTVKSSIDNIKSQMTQMMTQQACISSTCNT